MKYLPLVFSILFYLLYKQMLVPKLFEPTVGFNLLQLLGAALAGALGGGLGYLIASFFSDGDE